jgi:BirA family biotin operon repressor/biotin-[acetyl-CoA-carboxylase] ligase
VTYALRGFADPPRPELIGMLVGLCVAEVLGCAIAWPNDLMLGGKKVGGVLAEMVPAAEGKVPVVGVGVNLTVAEFPADLASSASSFSLEGRLTPPPDVLAQTIWRAIAARRAPESFADLAADWTVRDATPGKRYVLPDGREAIAQAVSPDGELIAVAAGETVTVPSAEAWADPANR